MYVFIVFSHGFIRPRSLLCSICCGRDLFIANVACGVAGDVQFFLMPWPNNFLRLSRKNVR